MRIRSAIQGIIRLDMDRSQKVEARPPWSWIRLQGKRFSPSVARIIERSRRVGVNECTSTIVVEISPTESGKVWHGRTSQGGFSLRSSCAHRARDSGRLHARSGNAGGAGYRAAHYREARLGGGDRQLSGHR